MHPLADFRELPAHRLAALGDEQLVEYLRAARQAGRHDAMRPAVAVLVHGYWDILVHRARLKLRTDADAEEVAAETVASAIASAFDGRSIGEFRSWLHTILSRRIADWWQKDERSVQTRPLPQPGDEEFAGHEPAVGFEGDAHVIRNAGGVVTDDALRSLALSQELLGTKEVVLIRHTDCRALAVAGEELDRSVREAIEEIRASPELPRTGNVRGFVYEVETGRLREVS